MITINDFQGHLTLLCKGHYKYKDIFAAFRMIWAIRCGYDYQEEKNNFVDQHIANELYDIVKKLCPHKISYLHELIHKELSNSWRYENLTPLECIILIYRSEIMMVEVKSKVGKKWKNFIKLPKPKKQVFNRILRGNGRYEDYTKIS